jgi:tetratricopeptide (TPR) repeat protein
MLVPMIGMVHAGTVARADRFTYLAQIGIYVAVTWLVAEWGARWLHQGPLRVALGGLMGGVVAVLMVCAWKQTAYWKNSETLWTRTLACTTGVYVDHNNIGVALLEKERADEAITHFQKALEIKPGDAAVQNNLGYTLLQKGSVDEAINYFQSALQIRPDFAEAHYNLGNALDQKGRVDEAITQFQQALQIKPDDADAHNNLGNALCRKGKVDEGISHFEHALQIRPGFAPAHYNLGMAFLRKGSVSDAIAHFEKALQIAPANPRIQIKLAWLLATCPQASLRNGARAVELAQKANALTGGENLVILYTLAAAYAEAGRFPEAVETAQRALQLAEAQSNTSLIQQLQFELKLYQAGNPFHSPAQTH